MADGLTLEFIGKRLEEIHENGVALISGQRSLAADVHDLKMSVSGLKESMSVVTGHIGNLVLAVGLLEEGKKEILRILERIEMKLVQEGR